MTLNEVSVSPVTRDLRAAPSLACDLSWIISVATRPSWRSKYPMLSEMFDGREELAERVRDFWSDQMVETCFTEMQVLAHHGGAIGETSPEGLWRALEQAVRTVPLDLALESEQAVDRDIFLDRLRRLKESPSLLSSYIGLLREVWEPIDAMWQAALPMLQEAGRQVLEQLDRGRPIGELLGDGCPTLRERQPEVTARVESGYPLLVVPCFFFGTSLYLEFPGLTLIGSGLEQNDLGARARTESVARRLKTVADPTRLALLHYLATMPSTVGDLASSFRLAQPTVSMHVKLLREAGLVTSARHEGRLQLRADPMAVESLLDDLRGVVVQGAKTTGNVLIPATVVDATRSAGPVTA
jgi:DNA-binding transcriptional ArsR family regulator